MNQRTAIDEDRDRTVLYLPNSETVREMTFIEWAVALAVIGISVWSFARLLGWH